MILTRLAALASHSQSTRVNTPASSFTTMSNPFRPSPPQSETQQRTYSNADLDLEEPPPYTPTPAIHAGEATIEQGPARPFQPAPSRPTHQPQQNITGSSSSYAPSPSTSQGRLGSGGSLLHQLSNSLNTVVRELTGPSPSPHPPQQQSYQWSSYPGQSQSQSQTYNPPPGPPPSHSSTRPPPPRHPSSSLPPPSVSSPPTTSDFARDFYAAGPADPTSHEYSPPLPPLPPSPPSHPSRSPSLSTTSSLRGHQRSVSTPGSSRAGPTNTNDGKPTTTPTPGHPLLRDGKLLVYPSGWECHKCTFSSFLCFYLSTFRYRPFQIFPTLPKYSCYTYVRDWSACRCLSCSSSL